MEKIYAFTDESGSFGWKLDDPNVSKHFIITAIIVKESQIKELTNKLEIIVKKYFQNGEMKSSKVGKNHKRRIIILNQLLNLDFSIFSVIINKADCEHMYGLKYKKTFYKFMNNIVHKELRRAFEKLVIVADELGSNEYMNSFIKYVKGQQEIPNLFNQTEFSFENSNNNVMIQLADFISGTLSYCYDENKKSKDTPNYLRILEKKTLKIMLYPKAYDNYKLETSSMAEEYDYDIANICFRQAAIFLEKNKDEDDKEIQAQFIVLEYLLFRFMNNDKRGYIPTKELISQLRYTIHENISVSRFRLSIICKLRDAGVIIASSNKGYKIPCKLNEIYDFINHGVSIAIPILERLRKCRDTIKIGTNGRIDVLEDIESTNLKKYFE